MVSCVLVFRFSSYGGEDVYHISCGFVGLFNRLGCLVACLWGLALVVYHLPGVG